MTQTDQALTDIDVELEPLIGTPVGGSGQVEKRKFLIFVSGIQVELARDKPRELIGYISKKPGSKIKFLPVAHAFSESLPEITQQVHAGVIAWRQNRVEQLNANLKAAESIVATTDADVRQRQTAIDAAAAALDAAAIDLATDQTTQRQFRVPDKRAVLDHVKEMSQAADAADATIDTAANDQNL